MSTSLEDLKFIFNEYIRKERKLKAAIAASILFSVAMTILVTAVFPQTAIPVLNDKIALKKEMRDLNNKVVLLEQEIANKTKIVTAMPVKNTLFNEDYSILDFVQDIENTLPTGVQLKQSISNFKIVHSGLPVKIGHKELPMFKKKIKMSIKRRVGKVSGPDIMSVGKFIVASDRKVEVVGINISAVNKIIASATIEIVATQSEAKIEK